MIGSYQFGIASTFWKELHFFRIKNALNWKLLQIDFWFGKISTFDIQFECFGSKQFKTSMLWPSQNFLLHKSTVITLGNTEIVSGLKIIYYKIFWPTKHKNHSENLRLAHVFKNQNSFLFINSCIFTHLYFLCIIFVMFI